MRGQKRGVKKHGKKTPWKTLGVVALRGLNATFHGIVPPKPLESCPRIPRGAAGNKYPWGFFGIQLLTRSFPWKRERGREFQDPFHGKGTQGREFQDPFHGKGTEEGNSKIFSMEKGQRKGIPRFFHGKGTQRREFQAFPWKMDTRKGIPRSFPCPSSFFCPKYSHPIGTSGQHPI